MYLAKKRKKPYAADIQINDIPKRIKKKNQSYPNR